MLHRKPGSWRATGPLPPGHSFYLLDSSASVESRDTLYYCLVRVAWHVLVAKLSPTTVPPPGRASQPSVLGITPTCTLGLIAYFASDMN